MPLLSSLYARVLRWSAHRHSQWYLAALSFAESSFFPIPPDVMLAPMCLAQRRRAWLLAGLTTLASVVGGIAGYCIGLFAFDVIEPLIERAGYSQGFRQVGAWFDDFGFWALFIAGFTPIPYKLFTVGAGVMHMHLLPFVLASLIGRGARFFLVAAFVFWGGEKMDKLLRTYVDRLGWVVIVLAVVAYLLYKL